VAGPLGVKDGTRGLREAGVVRVRQGVGAKEPRLPERGMSRPARLIILPSPTAIVDAIVSLQRARNWAVA
jgi:hypothetical protein